MPGSKPNPPKGRPPEARGNQPSDMNARQSAENPLNEAGVDQAGIYHTPHQAYKCGTRPFFRWVRTQERSPHASGGSKNASGPVGIPLKRTPQGPGNKRNPSKEG